MADYYSPTVIQQSIPIADMTALERLVLSLIFDVEKDGEMLYFHAACSPNDVIRLSLSDVRGAYEASAGVDSATTVYVAEHLADVLPEDTEIEFDFSVTSWEFIFQDIVRRSPTLRYVTAVTSFTYSKMRPDGFGGMAVLITADAVKGTSTSDILEGFLSEMEDDGSADHAHALIYLREHAVREQVSRMIETDPTLTRLKAEAVSAADIHAACLSVIAHADLSEEQGAAEFRAALAAIREAERRHAAST